MTQTQEEADRQFALLLSREQYYDAPNDYYEFYSDFENSPSKKKSKNTQKDGEWNPDGKKLQKKQTKKLALKPKADIQNDTILNETSKSCQAIEDASIPKKLKTVSEGMNTGKFTDEEVAKFRQGLELYGRDWNQIVKHIGTRDSLAVRSHAQKHFIKLFRDQIPLPAKVLESGAGYTLSGKELNPESSAAKPYLKAKRLSDEVKKETLNDSMQESKITAKKLTPVKKSRKSMQPESSSSDLDMPLDGQRTDYAKSRPVRMTAKPKMEKITFNGDYDDENAHRIIPCEKYSGVPGSGTPGSQPFRIRVSSQAIFMMDLHAHLLSTEVIGFLAGHWNATEKVLEVDSAIPCRSIEPNQVDKVLDRHMNVELDPASEVEMRELVSERKLRVVGWYHSHPTFLPFPSMIDLVNQKNYQEFFNSVDKDLEMAPSLEPFIGVIVGPFDPNLPKSVSAITWFNVGNQEEDMNRPKHLVIENKHSNGMVGLPMQELDKMLELINTCKCRVDRTDFSQGWRQDRWETRMDKLMNSLKQNANCIQEQQQVPNGWMPISNCLQKIEQEIQEWN